MTAIHSPTVGLQFGYRSPREHTVQENVGERVCKVASGIRMIEIGIEIEHGANRIS